MKKPSPCGGRIIAALMVAPCTTSELEKACASSNWTLRGYIQMFKETGVIRVIERHTNQHDEILALNRMPFEGLEDLT